MKYRTRHYYTDRQKSLMWTRWKEGWTLHQIGQLAGRPHTSIQNTLGKTGGIRPAERLFSRKTGSDHPNIRPPLHVDLFRLFETSSGRVATTANAYSHRPSSAPTDSQGVELQFCAAVRL